MRINTGITALEPHTYEIGTEWKDYYTWFPRMIVDLAANKCVIVWLEVVETNWYSDPVFAENSGWIYRTKR